MRSGFFNNKLLTVEDFAHFGRGLFTNGVLLDAGGELAVSAGTSGMAFDVAAGYCWINGRYGQAENAETVTLTNGDGSNPRKDRIVVRLDIDSAEISIRAVEGTPAASPTAPDLTRTSTVYELGLAVIDVPAGAITAGACTVTDTRRDTTVCGGAFPNYSGAAVWPTSAMVVGEMKMYAGETAPDKWLFCRGQSLSTSDYPDLFAVIGYTYGGSGSTFQLPDMSERFPRGTNPEASASSARTLGGHGGGAITLSTANLPSHSHTVTVSGGTLTASKLTQVAGGSSSGIEISAIISTPQGYTVADGSITAISASAGDTGSGQSVNVVPKYLNVNYIIYTGVSAQ